MQLLQKLLNKLNGLYYPQEYLCLAKESFQNPLHVYLINEDKIIKDITNEHLFTGYCPLIITFNLITLNTKDPPETIEIIFTTQSHQPNDHFEKKDAIAKLSLKLISKQQAGDIAIFHYEGVRGVHHFLSSFHQFIIRLYNMLYNKKQGNVFLPGNLYKQVQIAYALPRVISLITISDGKLFNLFPTDLHGPVSDQYYVSSLRHEGMACKQVVAARRIVISQMHCDAYKMVYSLGKNHMQELKSKDNFPFGESLSTVFHLPLPRFVLFYRELELADSFTHGIHQIFLYKIISQQHVSHEPVTLAHVHNSYASWRHNKGLAGNYLLR